MARKPIYGKYEWERILDARRAERHARFLCLMAEGCTDAEIAVRTHYARDTVKGYLRELYRDLGARNRTHAVAIAYTKGIIS